MTPYFYIENVTFNDGTNVKLEYNDIVVFVGANNSGKSASLKEMYKKLEYKINPTKIITDITIKKNRTNEEIKAYLNENSKIKKGNNTTYKGFGYSITDLVLSNVLRTRDELISLTNLFANFVGTENRLTISNPANNINFTDETYSHPIHFLYRDDRIESAFSDYFKLAFNQDLIVHRSAGNKIPIYIGDKPVLEQGEDRVSSSYIERLEKLDLLHEQGDGMRSFLGVLLNTFVSTQNILFIDEPEAFLHPPQARLLGQMLSNNLPSHKQLFISTHSEDLLKGLLESSHNRLKIIRLNRVNNINHINILDNSDIKEIWSDPLLRHSNILSGLFHKKVVICESDSDCRFYSAILASIIDNKKLPSPDLLFIHCGGKQRIPVVVKSLQKLNIPTLVISDFDVLNNETPLKEIFQNLGGDWDSVNKNWKIVKTEIDKKRPELLTDDVKSEIQNILDSTEERIFPKEKITEIKNILKKASAWSEAKSNGISYIPNGDATKAYQEIKCKFEEKGLLIVEVGELENFDKSIGNHGPKWVNEVLKKNLYDDIGLQSARDFVHKLII